MGVCAIGADMGVCAIGADLGVCVIGADVGVYDIGADVGVCKVFEYFGLCTTATSIIAKINIVMVPTIVTNIYIYGEKKAIKL